MKRVELLKIVGMVVVSPILVWLFTMQGTVNEYREYSTARHELSTRDSVRTVETKVDLSLIDFISTKGGNVVKYNRYVGDNSVIINELDVNGDFIELVKLIDSIEEYWGISSITFTSDKAVIIIQEL